MIGVQGRRVLVTRSMADSKVWARRLEEFGATAVVFPCIECVLESDPDVARELTVALSRAAWLVLCSKRAVHAVVGLLEIAGSSLPDSVRVAVVGPATAKASRDQLGRVDLVAEAGTSEALCDELAAQVGPDERVVAALSELSDHSIQKRLSAAGADVRRVTVYRTRPFPFQQARLSFTQESVDLAFLASPSAVTGLLNRATVSPLVPVVTIGPTTTTAARFAGLHVVAEASERGLEAMIQALENT